VGRGAGVAGEEFGAGHFAFAGRLEAAMTRSAGAGGR
jgi:hypothetical protein